MNKAQAELDKSAAKKGGNPSFGAVRMLQVKTHWLHKTSAVRAAVAELIEADRAYDNARSGVEATAYELEETNRRRAAALRRVGGAA